MNKCTSIMLLLATLTVGLLGCSSPNKGNQDIMVTIEPERYFAEKIGKDHFSVHTVVPIGQSPEAYDPTPQEMVLIGQSMAYFKIGRIGFEQAWMGTIKENSAKLQIFDLSQGVQWIEDAHHGHAHENEAEGNVDPHIWNSTDMAFVIAKNTLNAYIALDPDNEAYYTENYQLLNKEITETKQMLHQMLDTLTSRSFIIYHPALSYFAREFNLEQLSIESEGKEPSAASMKALIDKARQEKVQVVFVQQEFDSKHAQQIANEIGARLVTINPLNGQWSDELIHTAKALTGNE